MISECDVTEQSDQSDKVKMETMTEPDPSSSVPMRKRTVTAVSSMITIGQIPRMIYIVR
jgi:hypothetical protein